MSQGLSFTPGPWSRTWSDGGLILVTSQTAAGLVTIAAVSSDREADAIAISLVPDMLLAVKTGDLAAARAAIDAAGLGA